MEITPNDQSFIQRWSVRKIVSLGLVMGFLSVFSIFFCDQALAQWFYETFHASLDGGAHIITWFGLGDTYFAVAVIGYFLPRVLSPWLSHWGFLRRLVEARAYFTFMFLSFLFSGVIVLLLKALFGRSRPYNTAGYYASHFEPLTLNWDFHSYPSGHSQVGFTLASFLSLLYPKGTPYFFSFAALIALSRVILEKHYLGDVLAGAYIGILGTYLAWQWKGKKILPLTTHRHLL